MGTGNRLLRAAIVIFLVVQTACGMDQEYLPKRPEEINDDLLAQIFVLRLKWYYRFMGKDFLGNIRRFVRIASESEGFKRVANAATAGLKNKEKTNPSVVLAFFKLYFPPYSEPELMDPNKEPMGGGMADLRNGGFQEADSYEPTEYTDDSQTPFDPSPHSPDSGVPLPLVGESKSRNQLTQQFPTVGSRLPSLTKSSKNTTTGDDLDKITYAPDSSSEQLSRESTPAPLTNPDFNKIAMSGDSDWGRSSGSLFKNTTIKDLNSIIYAPSSPMSERSQRQVPLRTNPDFIQIMRSQESDSDADPDHLEIPNESELSSSSEGTVSGHPASKSSRSVSDSLSPSLMMSGSNHSSGEKPKSSVQSVPSESSVGVSFNEGKNSTYMYQEESRPEQTSWLARTFGGCLGFIFCCSAVVDYLDVGKSKQETLVALELINEKVKSYLSHALTEDELHFFYLNHASFLRALSTSQKSNLDRLVKRKKYELLSEQIKKMQFLILKRSFKGYTFAEGVRQILLGIKRDCSLIRQWVQRRMVG